MPVENQWERLPILQEARKALTPCKSSRQFAVAANFHLVPAIMTV
ncbi:MAG TPA: hypothetical protein VIK35_02345 [Verrucomicrobiae bacterium]